MTNARGQLAILVAGMHRSGTSAVTGALTKLGIDAPGQLLSSDEYNEKGYFENRRIVQFHDQLLGELGSSWCDPLPLASAWMESALGRAAAENLASLVKEEFAGVPAFVIKDPRLCRLMPLWQTALERLGKDVKVILPVRHPLEVARSISSRNGLPFVRCKMLWLQYVLSAEAMTRGLPRSIVFYEDVLKDWRSSLTKVGSDLELAWPRDFERAASELEDFVSPDLKHADVEGWPAGMSAADKLCASALDAYGSLKRAAYDREATESLDRVARTLDEVFSIVGPVLHREIEWNDAHNAEIARIKDESQARVVQLEQGTLEADRDRIAAEKESMSLRVQLSDMRAKVQEVQVKLAKQTITMKLQEEFESFRAQHEERYARLVDSLHSSQCEIKKIDGRVEHISHSMQRFEAIMNTRFVQIPRLFFRGYRRIGRLFGRR